MTSRHDKFIYLENIKNFEKRLETETDITKKAILIRLMEEEKAKWRALVKSRRATWAS